MTAPCPLEKALSYDNLDVVQRFLQLYDVSEEEAQDIFSETKKWIWLASQPDSNVLAIIDPLLIVDEMWHNFILFTHDYTRYCFDCYGRYIHHQPTTQGEKARRRQQLLVDPVGARDNATRRLHDQCALICAKLGSATLLKWFVDYPQRYDEAFLSTGRKQTKWSYAVPTSLQVLSDSVTAGRIRIGPGHRPVAS
jgi:hypothetical protein